MSYDVDDALQGAVEGTIERVGQMPTADEGEGFTGPASSAAWWRRKVIGRWSAGMIAATRSGPVFGCHYAAVTVQDGASIVAAADRSGEVRWGAGVMLPNGAAAVEFMPSAVAAYDMREKLLPKVGASGRLLGPDGLPALRP